MAWSFRAWCRPSISRSLPWRSVISTPAMFVTPSTDTGIKILYDNPREVGADRVVNGVAGFHKYGGPCVVVDLGTTINFDVVSEDAEFLGGLIAPGIGCRSADFSRGPPVCPWWIFARPKDLVGSNTVGSIQSGLYYGFVGLIDGVVERIAAQLGPAPRPSPRAGRDNRLPTAPGWLRSTTSLTLEGLRLIWERNRIEDEARASKTSLTENYFTYFTEIEDHFQRARGTGLFLLSPLDWALIESWKNADIPLEAVLRGIDQAFEKVALAASAWTRPDGKFSSVLRSGDSVGSAGDGGRRFAPESWERRATFLAR